MELRGLLASLDLDLASNQRAGESRRAMAGQVMRFNLSHAACLRLQRWARRWLEVGNAVSKGSTCVGANRTRDLTHLVLRHQVTQSLRSICIQAVSSAWVTASFSAGKELVRCASPQSQRISGQPFGSSVCSTARMLTRSSGASPGSNSHLTDECLGAFDCSSPCWTLVD